MSAALYLAEGESGQYDDWNHWTVGVFSTRAKAKAACKVVATSAQKDLPVTWTYDAKTGESSATVKYRFDYGTYTVRRIKVDKTLF